MSTLQRIVRCSALGFLVIPLIALTSESSYALVVYVDQGAPPGGSGAAWETALRSIQAGIDAVASTTGEVWVREGTYPEGLSLKDGVAVYGGFSGSETSREERDFAVHLTRIDAATAEGGSPADHAVIIAEVNDTRLDGFTITGGHADGGGIDQEGGGIHVSRCGATNVIENCVIEGNTAVTGGGVCLRDSDARLLNCLIRRNGNLGALIVNGRPEVADCIISDNTGGGVHVTWDPGDSSPPVPDRPWPDIHDIRVIGNFGDGVKYSYQLDDRARLENAVIAGNTGHGLHVRDYYVSVNLNRCLISGNLDGGVFNDYAVVSATNCLISGNQADYGGAASCYAEASLFMNLCTLVDNAASMEGGGVYEAGSPPYVWTRFNNCLFAGNRNHAIYCSTDSNPDHVVLTLRNNLFHGNPEGDVAGPTLGVLSGADVINSSVAGATDNVDGDPWFVMGVEGTWTSAPVYDATSNRTLLTDAFAAFTPGALEGRLLKADASESLQTYVTGNTATSVEVAGDVASIIGAGTPYIFVDYHLANASAAIDNGTTAGITDRDYEGLPRPLDTVGRGADGTGTEYDIGAYECQDAAALPTAQIGFGPETLVLHHPPEDAAISNATGTLAITGEDLTDLRGYAFTIAYGTGTVDVSHSTDIVAGPFLGSTGNACQPSGPVIDHHEGRVSYGSTSEGVHPGPSGSGTLAWVTWSTNPVRQVTQCALQFEAIRLVDSDMRPMPYAGGTATVTVCHYADLDCDDGVDIVDVQMVAGRWNSFAGDAVYAAISDIDRDGDVDIIDVQRVAGHWNTVAPFAE